MAYRSSESVETPDQQDVAGAKLAEAGIEPWSVTLCARHLVGENQLGRDSMISQGIELESQLLAFRADPSVSDKASAVGKGDHGIALLSDLMCVLILDADRLHSVPRSWATSFRNWVVFPDIRKRIE
jgi:hypothetical protein